MAKFCFLLFCLLTLFCTHKTFGADGLEDKNIDENARIYKKYIEMDKQLQKYVESGVKRILPSVLESNLNITGKCAGNLLAWISGIRKLKLWALSLLDASGKISDGVLVGNVQNFGDYDQCLNTTVRKKSGAIDFRGQYCLLDVSYNLPSSNQPLGFGNKMTEFIDATKNGSELLRFFAQIAHFTRIMPASFGACVPSGCTKDDIGQIVKYAGENVMLNITVDSCQVEGWLNFYDTTNITTICLYCLLGIIGIFASVLTYYFKDKEDKEKSVLTKVLLCFSLTSNFQKLMNTKQATDTTLPCLHGIRVLSLFHIIMAHQMYLRIEFITIRHTLQFSNIASRFSMQALSNGLLSVETFFFIGGFLHSYVRAKNEIMKDSRIKLSYIKMIFFRIWRLAPPYVFAILTMQLMRPTKGPLSAKFHKKFFETCEKYWWKNLLFINNLFNDKTTCLHSTWYIAADMQMFLLSMFFVTLLIRHPGKGIVANVVVIILGITSTAVWCWTHKSPPVVDLYRPNKESMESFALSYSLPFAHIAPYFTGIIMGYFLATSKNIKIPKVTQVIGWPTAFLCYTSILFVSYVWNNGAVYTRLEASLYFSLGRLVLSLAIAWMVFCCAVGQGGIINYILSMKLWVPLSRMSYTIYLISPIVQAFNYTNAFHISDFENMTLIWQHFGDIVVSCLFAMAIVLLVESPSIALQNLLFKRKRKNGSEEQQEEGIQNDGFSPDVVKNNTASKQNGVTVIELKLR